MRRLAGLSTHIHDIKRATRRPCPLTRYIFFFERYLNMSFPPPPPPPPPPPQASAGRSFGPIRDSPRPHRGHSHHNSRGHGPRSTGPQGNFYQSANASRGQGLIPGGAFGQGRSYGPGSKFPQLPQSSGGPGAYDSRNGFDRNRGNFLQSSSRPPKGQNAPGSMYNLGMRCPVALNQLYFYC